MGAAFSVGDRVHVLNSCRLPKVEEIRVTGVIKRITESALVGYLYWVDGLWCGVAANVLRHAGEDSHLSVNGTAPRTLSEKWAIDDEENKSEESWG